MLAGGVDPGEPRVPSSSRRAAPRAMRRAAGVGMGWRAVRRVGRTVVPVGAVGIALVGAPLHSSVTLTAAPSLAVFAAGVVAMVHPDFPARVRAWRAAVLAACTGAAAVPFLAGVAALGVVGAVAAISLLTLASLLLADRALEAARAGAASSEASLRWLRQAAPTLPTSSLVDQWRVTDVLMRGRTDPEERSRGIEVRAVLLEALTRRDPVGVAAWVRQPGSPPDAYIRDEQRRGN